MRNIYLLALFLLSLAVFPQGIPQGINYQGVARNAAGDPITTPISVKVEIHQGSSNGGVVCSEVFPNVNPNPFGVFALQIGTVSPAQFSAITWSTGTFFVGVSIDPNNGTSFGTEVSNQKLMSVPYALYAERTGGSGPTTTITSTYPSIISVNSAPPSHTINYTPPQLTLTADTVLRIVQGAHTSSAVILKSGGSTATATPNGPWNSSGSNVFLLSPANNVGIGTSTPTAKLEVNTNTLSTNNAIAAYAQGGNGLLALTSSTNNLNAAVLASNNGSGSGIVGVTLANNGITAGVQGNNNGTGPGVYGSNTMSSTASTAHGVVGETNSGNAAVAGVIGVNNGQGPGVYGYQSLPTGGPGIWGVSNSSSEAGVKGVAYGGAAGVTGDVGNAANSPNANGVFGRTNSPHSAANGVFGQNAGAGHGVMGIASANNFTANAIFGRNVGLGGGVYGEAFTTSSIVAAVQGNQLGIGPAVRASIPTGTNSSSPNVALLIENGHIQATSVGTPSFVSANNTGTNVGTAVLVTGSNDVRGMVTLNVTPTANWAFQGYHDFTVLFHKSYMTGGPWVTIAKYDTSNFIYEIVNVTTTAVTFRIRNGSPGMLAPGAGVSQLKFMYMVMQ